MRHPRRPRDRNAHKGSLVCHQEERCSQVAGSYVELLSWTASKGMPTMRRFCILRAQQTQKAMPGMWRQSHLHTRKTHCILPGMRGLSNLQTRHNKVHMQAVRWQSNLCPQPRQARLSNVFSGQFCILCCKWMYNTSNIPRSRRQAERVLQPSCFRSWSVL